MIYLKQNMCGRQTPEYSSKVADGMEISVCLLYKSASGRCAAGRVRNQADWAGLVGATILVLLLRVQRCAYQLPRTDLK